jgi:hypothetical protein
MKWKERDKEREKIKKDKINQEKKRQSKKRKEKKRNNNLQGEMGMTYFYRNSFLKKYYQKIFNALFVSKWNSTLVVVKLLNVVKKLEKFKKKWYDRMFGP